jgi:glycosyltransferase involved in cell wall biosynthesis
MIKASKRILLIAPRYFNYDVAIKEYLEEKGYEVDLMNDRPYNSNILKAIIRINRSIIDTYLYFFYKFRFLDIAKQNSYEVIFVIQGEGLTPRFLKWLRAKLPFTPMVYYLWDSIKNKPQLAKNIPYFDQTITFDYQDAKKIGLDFVPLFFLQKNENKKNTKILYDISFIGSVHDDRSLLLRRLKKNSHHLKLFVFLYAPSRWIFYLRSLVNKDFFNLDMNDLNFEQLAYDEVQKICQQSKVILDIHHRNQTGLTIRTIETIALQKKIATTNSEIKHYDFYNPHNIFILDRKNFKIPTSFFKQPFKPLPQNIISRYSIQGFFDSTLGPYLDKKNHKSKSEPSIAILMTTFNGQKFLEEQLNSIKTQLHRNWRLYVSDDGSTDKTLSILKSYQKLWGKHKLIIRYGPQKTFSQNFLSLVTDKRIKADFYAYCDQDDVWLPSKLSVAIKALQKESPKIPLLYCGRTTYVDERLQIKGLSPLYNKPANFKNALVQSIAGGNTMVFNANTKKLLEGAGKKEIISHDWWTYLLVTCIGGRVIYDEFPQILYRQHEGGLIGANTSIKDNMKRFKGLIEGQFRAWISLHIAALTSSNLKITQSNQVILASFLFYRLGNVFERMKMVKMNSLYRQSWQGNISLYLAALLNRL